MGFSRQEYWSALPCPPPEDLPSPGIESTSLMYSALGGGSLPLVPIGKPICVCVYIYIYICIKKYFWMQPVHRGQCPAWTLCSGAPQRRVAGYVLGLGRCTAPLVVSQDHSRRNLREEVGSSKQVSTRWTPTVLQLPGPQGPFQRCSDVTPGSLLACL